MFEVEFSWGLEFIAYLVTAIGSGDIYPGICCSTPTHDHFYTWGFQYELRTLLLTDPYGQIQSSWRYLNF